MRGQPGGQGSGSAFTSLGKERRFKADVRGLPGGHGARKSVNDPFGEVHLASVICKNSMWEVRGC